MLYEGRKNLSTFYLNLYQSLDFTTAETDTITKELASAA